MVGSAAAILVASVTVPLASKGTLKSTRIKARSWLNEVFCRVFMCVLCLRKNTISSWFEVVPFYKLLVCIFRHAF